VVNWLSLFQQIAQEIYHAAEPLLGSEKANERMSRGAGGDVTKYIDSLAENIVIQTLQAEQVSCILVSEECGTMRIGADTNNFVVLDSIDGTTNATRGIPFVSTSIAHASGNYLSDIDVALVKDLNQGIEFSAIKDNGAYKERELLRLPSVSVLERAIIAIHLTPKKKIPMLINSTSPLISQAHKIRNLGSTALEICYVASGALDAFIDLGGLARVTDIAAAYLILKEAGGISATPLGTELNLPLKVSSRASFISASTQTLLDEIIQKIEC
jgi:myo-inositol-1(or 4)-monophosphatase